MNNKKGFTLIELLVAITIVGIIIIMTLPAIKNLQRENQEKKFKDYERAVLEAAKVYEDQYEEDLFGRSDSGCAYIDYTELLDKKLLNTTKISGYECNSINNGIIIRKVKGKSYYEVYLTCSKGTSDTKNLTENTGYTGIKTSYCNPGEDYIPPTLTIKCDNDTKIGVEGDDFGNTGIYYYSATNEGTKKIPNLNVKAIDANSGLDKNQYVTYEWKIYKTSKFPNEQNPEFKEKNKATFNTKTVKSTSEKKVRIVEEFKKQDTTGEAVVDIIGENIIDKAGNKLDATLDEAKETCKYFYDNAKPEIEIILTGASGTNYNIHGNEWIKEPITTSVTVTDKTDNNIYSGIQPDTFTRNEGSETLTGGLETYSFSRSDDNREEVDTFRVCDKVGNCHSDTVNIRVDTTPPVCGKVSTDSSTPWTNQTRTVTIGCSDNLSGCKTNTFKKDFPDDSTTGTITIEDNAGNTTDCEVYTKVDKTKPVCTSYGEDLYWRNTSLTINATCTDNLSGCKLIPSNEYKGNVSTTTGYAGQACDWAGNCDDCSKDQNVHIDINYPTCEFREITTQNVADTPLVMTLHCADDKALKRCAHDDADTEYWDSDRISTQRNIVMLGAAGTYDREVVDMAGNTGSCSITIVESRCTSTCCGTHDCRPYNCHCSNGSCDTCYHQCANTCTSGECCGYHVQ